MNETKKAKGKWFSWFAVALFLVVAYFSSVLISQQVHLNQVARDQEMAEARLAAAKREHAALEKERDDLVNREYIEKIAREELGMTKQGELPYIPGKK